MKMKLKNRVSRTRAPKRGAAFAEQRLIGLIGAGPAVGVTHTAVMMAGYLTGICRRRCAVLEWNGSGTFDRLEESCLGKGTEAGAEAFLSWTWITTEMRGQRLWCCAKSSVIRM